MAAYKRSDPKKLKAEREAIERDMARFKQSPEDSLMEETDKDLDKRGYSGSPNRGMGSSWGFNRPKTPGMLERIKTAYHNARMRAKLRRNPPPRERGARVIGVRKPRTEA